jgi:hypothetical protein
VVVLEVVLVVLLGQSDRVELELLGKVSQVVAMLCLLLEAVAVVELVVLVVPRFMQAQAELVVLGKPTT